MIYVGSLVSGVINGIFASGAGQILVFMFVFLLKMDTHKSRATSIFAIGILTAFTVIRYISMVNVKLNHVILVAIFGLIFGIVGAKIMKKMNSDGLNLVSGIVITGFALYSIVVR